MKTSNFDIKNQSFPGQEKSEDDSMNKQPDYSSRISDIPPWLRRDKNLSEDERRRARKYLDSLSDNEIINIYYKLRDEKEEFDGGFYYPNIQILFETPFEREKDRREQKQWAEKNTVEEEVIKWYKAAKEKSCVWWIENHVIARHALSSCMSCGACTALCPAAEFMDYNPRIIMETVQEKHEDAIINLLKTDMIWYCYQCGSCKPKCPRGNNPFGMITSLRQLSQLKGYHINSIRGRQQYAALHLWGGNLWNRACTLYFRNLDVESHRDFGPRFEIYFKQKEEAFRRLSACPDMNGSLSGRKVHPDTLDEVRRLWHAGGGLYFWGLIEEAARKQAEEIGVSIDEYYEMTKSEG